MGAPSPSGSRTGRMTGLVFAAGVIAAVLGALWRSWRRSAVGRGGRDPQWSGWAVAPVACPHCRSAPSWDAAERAYACPDCARAYPVREGIVHFLEADELGPMDRRFAHLYDWFSWVYPAFTRVGFALLGSSESRGRAEVLDRLDPRGGRLLEVSVGPGSNLPYLVGRADIGEVHALDISIGQLRRCRNLVRRRGWSVPMYLASAEALPFADDSFDAVLHIGGINFFDDVAAAMAEMARVAKPGVRVVIVDENERGARAYERTLPGFRSSFDGARPAITAPVGLVPEGMEQVSVSGVWRGWFYCLEFVTPGECGDRAREEVARDRDRDRGGPAGP